MWGYLERRVCAGGEEAERVMAQMEEGGVLIVGWDRRAEMTADPWRPVAPAMRKCDGAGGVGEDIISWSSG